MKLAHVVRASLSVILIVVLSFSLLFSLSSVKATPEPEEHIVSIGFYSDEGLEFGFSVNNSGLYIDTPIEITRVETKIYTTYGENGAYWVIWAMTNPNAEDDGDIRFDNSVGWTDENVVREAGYEYVDETFLYVTFYDNFTTPFSMDSTGTYYITVSQEWFTPEYTYVWDQMYNYIWYLQGFSVKPQDDYSRLILDGVWLLVIFFPALILNSFLPKIGFVAGLIIMTSALWLSDVMPPWLFFISLIGVIIIMWRGDK